METTLMAIRELRRPGPIIATMAMARSVAGNARRMSMQNIRMRSTRRPTYPARRPRIDPMTAATRTEPTPRPRETRDPWRIRIRISRPSASVPKGWVQLGGLRRARRSESTWGSYGRRTGLRTAITAKPAMMTRPPRATRLASSRCQAASRGLRPLAPIRAWTGSSIVLDAGIDCGIKHVREKVHHDEDRRDEQGRTLDDGIVARLDGLVDPEADPRPGENRLRQDGPGQQAPDLQSGDGHDRQKCVAHRVAQDHGPLGEPL